MSLIDLIGCRLEDIPHDQFVNGGDDFVVVSRHWYERAQRLLAETEMDEDCPFCGAIAPPVVEPADETFYGRAGCRVCNRWWGQKRLKKRG